MNINDFQKKWITEQIDIKAVEFAEWFGKHLCDITDNRVGRLAMTTSQIRNVFGEVKRIQAKGYDLEKPAFFLLRPKIAYAEARVNSKSSNPNVKFRISDFRKVIELAHSEVKNEIHFQNFVDFFEAILAYHKASGGRES